LGILDIIRKSIIGTPPTVPAEIFKNVDGLTKDDILNLKKLGTTLNYTDDIQKQTLVNFDRYHLYREIDRSLGHWAMAAAAEIYGDTATTHNPIFNSTVWITSENKKYETELTDLIERLCLEEKMFDWAWSCTVYGDLFVKVIAEPGKGIIAIEDDDHPINISRVDYRGTLIGFFTTPNTGFTGDVGLLPPWDYVHFRILGAKVRRPLFGDPNYSEFRTTSLMSVDSRRLTSKYGTSLLANALHAYQRLRLAEDSLLLARLTRGVEKYIYKVKVDGSNVDAVSSIITEYATTLKRARALNTGSSPKFDETFNPLGTIKDLIIPVWGDAKNDLIIESVGVKPDIKWIVDIEELRNQLACALRVPLSLLGGYTDEATGILGSNALEQLDIRFARNARRVQRALKEGIKRLSQIHLAFLGMDPDPKLFNVNLSETSTAEEKELKESLDTAIDIVDKMIETFGKVDVKLDKVKLLNYLNSKMIKFNDFDIEDYVIPGLPEDGMGGARPGGGGPGLGIPDIPGGMKPEPGEEPRPGEEPLPGEEEDVEDDIADAEQALDQLYDWIETRSDGLIIDKRIKITNSDFLAALPKLADMQVSKDLINEGRMKKENLIVNNEWLEDHGQVRIVFKEDVVEQENEDG